MATGSLPGLRRTTADGQTQSTRKEGGQTRKDPMLSREGGKTIGTGDKSNTTEKGF